MKITQKQQKIVLFVLFAVMLSGALLFLHHGCFREPRQLVRHVVTVSMPNLPAAHDGLKIAVISDLHLRPDVLANGLFDKMFTMLEQLKPDLILLPGDFMNKFAGRNLSFSQLTIFLNRFHAPFGVYAVTGNHDYRAMQNGMRESFAASRVKLLENILIQIPIRGENLQLAGVSDFVTRQANLPDALRAADQSRPIILMSHVPELFLHPQNIAVLTISGHTHGGQIDLPMGINGCRFFNFNQTLIRGHYRRGDRHLALTSGIGTSTVEIRAGVKPEIMLITLKRPSTKVEN